MEVGAAVTFVQYATIWLERIQQTRKVSTYCDYDRMVRKVFLPAFGNLELCDVTREKVKRMAYQSLKQGQSPMTVQNLVRGLSSMLSHAVEDGLLTNNRALRPGKFMPRVSKRRSVDPFDRSEVVTLLRTVQKDYAAYYPLLLCAVRTGLRQGELIALQWADIDFHSRFIEVQRNLCKTQNLYPQKRGVSPCRYVVGAGRDAGPPG